MSETKIKKQDIPILSQSPDGYDEHPLNLLKVMGAQVVRFRATLPKEYKSQEGFAKLLESYRGSPVNRRLVKRIEDGDPGVAIGMFFACFDIMKMTKKIMDLFVTEANLGDQGDETLLENIRHARLNHAIEQAKKNLNQTHE